MLQLSIKQKYIKILQQILCFDFYIYIDIGFWKVNHTFQQNRCNEVEVTVFDRNIFMFAFKHEAP